MAIIENPHMYNLITDTFNANPEEITIALLWRQQYLEKKREYNKQYYIEKTRNDPDQYEESKRRSKEWFQNNKVKAAARQKARYENDPEYKKHILEYKKQYYFNQKVHKGIKIQENVLSQPEETQ